MHPASGRPGASSRSHPAARPPRGGVALPLDPPAGRGMRALRAHARACLTWITLMLLLVLGAARAALPPNTPITNTATVSFSVGGSTRITSTGAATVTTATVTPATISFHTVVPVTAVQASANVIRQSIATTACRSSAGSWSAIGASVPGYGTVSMPGSYHVAPAVVYAASDLVLVRVTDLSRNLDPQEVESALVTVSSASGDSETLRVKETGPSTGVFIGYIGLSQGTPQPGNCTLQAHGNERLTASYVQTTSNTLVTSVALVDPLGLVFDSSTGQPIDGARVTLLDAATGLPAQVRGDDGISTYPSTVVTGSTTRDSGGQVYPQAAGRYQFPRVSAPGTYQLKIEPPQGYRHPSQVADSTLQQLPGGPFVLNAASRGGSFTVLPGPPVQADVPLDPGPLGEVDIQKTSDKQVVAAGDLVPYRLRISNAGTSPLPGVVVADRLPAGFRYRAGSARLDDRPLTDPEIGPDGRSMLLALGTIPARSAITLQYVAVVGPSAKLGPAENTAQTLGRILSNVARSSVTVRDDLNRTRAFLAGRVTVNASCDASPDDPAAQRGLKGVRLLLQDGTFVVTDADGSWHMDHLRPGTHVVQIDPATLPQGMQLRNCAQNSRTGGRDFSQFVNLQGGTLWRADFRLVPVGSCVAQEVRREGHRVEVTLTTPVATESLSATVLWPAGARADAASVLLDGKPAAGVQLENDFLVLRLPQLAARARRNLSFALQEPVQGPLTVNVRAQPAGSPVANLQPLTLAAGASQAAQCAPLPMAAMPEAAKDGPGTQRISGSLQLDAPRLVEELPYDDQWIAAAAPGIEWLHPQTGFTPALPAIKVAVKHARDQTLELRVNGLPVDPLRFEGTQLSPSGAVAVSQWRGVDIRDGANVVELAVRNAAHEVVHRESRSIHYGVNPARVELDPQRSRLVADGRTVPVVAVRLLDSLGKPVRGGARGEFEVSAPYASKQQADALQRDPLSGAIGGRAKYVIGDAGVALIELQPTGQSGEAVLRFDFGNNRTGEVRAWLESDARDWILVGFAEGSAGHRKLAGNMEALDAAGDADRLFERNRLAFYAKGMIKGDLLLTIAYDSARQRGTVENSVLRQGIDPNRYYTLYADATQQQYDAASVRRLYLKIEKRQFYAMFGDHDTGLTVTEFGRYSRTLNGFKSEYRGERFAWNAFAARTAQGFRKDEIQGDGTSGLYRLRQRAIQQNSEKVRIEVRDRFQPDRVLNTRMLTPWLDYQIDYDFGTLFLRAPLFSRDTELNPQFLVVEYESADSAMESWTYGGRAAVRIGEGGEAGATYIREGTIGRDGTLAALDARYRIDESTRMRAEVATSTRQAEVGETSGRAWLVEIQHDDGKLAWQAYARQQQPGFGLGQQSFLAEGQRKAGADVRLRATDTLELQAEAFRQESITTRASREVAQARLQWAATDDLRVSAGARVVSERDANAEVSGVGQVTAGVAYEMLDRKLLLRASTDLDVTSTGVGAVNYPNRLVLGADYRLTPETSLTLQQEFARAEALRVSTTRVGLRTRVWEGADLQAGLGSQAVPEAGRLFASLGLVQKLRWGEHWSADFGLDRVQTLRGVDNPLGEQVPPASGTAPSANSATQRMRGFELAGDGTAVTMGLAYRDEVWSANTRFEWRDSREDRKVNWLAGAQRVLAGGQAVAAGLVYTSLHGAAGDSLKGTARLSYVWRPHHSSWVVLNRLEYVQEASPSLATRLLTRKLINNLNANWRGARTQVALQYSAKYVREMLGETRGSGYTDLFGIEARHDVTDRWDVGLHAGGLRVHASANTSYHAGLSIGYRVAPNSWVSLGYNVLGFWDADFTGAEYRARGLFVNVKVKFDQDTFDLNDKARGQLPLKP